MLLLFHRLGHLLTFTLLAYQASVSAEELGAEPQPTSLNGADLSLRTQLLKLLKSLEYQRKPPTETHRPSDSTSRLASTAQQAEGAGLKVNSRGGFSNFFPYFRRYQADTEDRKPEVGDRKQEVGNRKQEVGGLARKDEGSNAIVDAGWNLFSTFSGALSPPEPPRKRKPIEDIPILGGLVSLGGALELAGQRSVDLLSDGSRKFGDLAVGTFSKSGFKYPAAGEGVGAAGLVGAVGGLGKLSPTDLMTVASALSQSTGRVDFIKQLLDKSTPETAFRLGQAAASITELRGNPAFAGIFRTFARRK
uniref:SP33.21 n=1 Tax=Bemisia tabaci TaxID=7038 RepID=A0A7S5HGR1_BEMTA|nr:SP33.21 [Bemisia tabaci]